jgi:hypothetical protein
MYLMMSLIHGPTHHSAAARASQVLCYGTIVCNTTSRNQPDYLVYHIEEIIVIIAAHTNVDVSQI